MPVKSLKRVIFLLFCLLLMQGVGAQVTIYSEHCGTAIGTTSIAANIWQNSSPIIYTGNADVRSTLPSDYSGASGIRNVFFAQNTSNYLQIEGINTLDYINIVLSFGHYKSMTAANNELVAQVSADGATWLPITYSRPTGAGTAIWTYITASGTIPSTSNLRIRFTQSSTTSQFRIDDIMLKGTINCPVTVTSFTPTTGPVGTQVTITGSNFTGATNVLFNGTSASSFNVINDNTIHAEVPIGATTGPVSVLNSCTGVSTSDFTVINTSCALSGSNLIISELCNPDVHNGKDRYIEIYNPTNAPINLAGWTVRAISNGGITASCIQWPLSGTINPGQALTCGNPNPDFGGPHSFSHVDWWATYPTNTNINDCYYNWNGQQRDGASLYNGTTRVDGIFRADSDNDWYSKKTLFRNPNVCSPNDNSPHTDWTADPTNVIHAGDFPSTPRSHTANCSFAKPTITLHPLSQSLCGSQNVTLTVSASGGIAPYNYVWKVYTGSGTWQTVTNTPPYSGAATNSLTITSLPIGFDGYQYYCEVWNSDNSCYQASNVAVIEIADGPILIVTNPPSVCAPAVVDLTSPSITVGSTLGTATLSYWQDAACTFVLPNPTAVSASGTYYIKASQGVGCESIKPVEVVIHPAAVAPTSVTSDRTHICANDAGTITLTAIGGSGSSIEWFEGTCGGTVISNLVSFSIASPVNTTTYFARWTSSSCGNSVCASVTVTVDNPILADAGLPQSKCGTLTTNFEGNDPTPGTGMWTIVSGPGTALITSPSLFSSSVSVSAQGSYVFRWTITPPGGVCLPHSDDVVIEFSDAVTVTASSNTPVCVGNNLYLYSSISGATYSWTGPGTFTSSDKDPVIYNAQLSDAGDYTVVVTGIPGGCPTTSATTNVVINESPVAPAGVASSSVSLCSNDNGNITLTASGGSGNMLEWFDNFCGGNLIGTGNNLSLPSPTVTTTYYARWNSGFCGSSSCQSVTVVVSDPPSIANAGGDMDVCGFNTSMSATVPTVGTGQWSQVSGPVSVVFGNISSPTSSVSTTLIGTYILRWTVTNMPQCPASTDDVSVTFGNSVTVVASSNGPVCVGDTIRLYSSISGATYSWTGPGTYTSNVQNPIIPDAQISDMGDYFVTVTNIPGNCPTTNDYVAVIVSNIPSTSPINNNASGVDEVCSNSNTPYTIDPPTPGSTYEWVLTGGGDIIPTASSNLINVQWNSTFGTFVLKVVETSAGGCQGDTVRMLVTVNSLSTPAITISASQNPVCTGSDVTFTSSIQEGGASPQYKWYVNGIGPVGSNSTYSYFPTDGDIVTCKLTSSSPCALSNPATSNTVTMTVAGTVAATIGIASPTQSVCIGELAEVQAVLGNGGANPDITWYRNGVEIVGEKSAVLSFFPANGDKIKARLISSSSCASPAQANSEELMFIVSNMLPLGVQVSQDPAACYGQPLVIKALATNMGLTPVYEWFCNGISLPGLSGSSISRTFAENDSVSVKVTSSLSCATGSPATSPKLKVIMPAQLLVTKVDTVWASCGAADGSIVVEASGGTGAYKYSILPAESWRSSIKFDSIAPNTQYRVKVKDQNDCVSEYGIVTISSKPGPLVSVSGPGYACEGSPLAVDAISPHTGLNYEWLGPSGATMTGNQLVIPQVQLSDSGVYIARGSNVNGCFDTAMYKLRVMPVPIIDFGLESTACEGVAYDLDAGSGFTSYKWQDGSTNQSYSAQVKGTYFVEVTDADGCKGGDTLFIIPCGEVSFPNAFSPNKDSKNDYFLPVTGGINPKGFRLIIFNSWGQKLFETTDPTTGWDGSALGGEAPVGIYTYVATFSMPDPDNTSVYLKPVTRRGLVVLLR